MSEEATEHGVLWTVLQCCATFCNLGLPVLVGFAGVLGVMGVNDLSDTSDLFMALYMIIFSALLFVFEVTQITNIQVIDIILKKNFGYLYGPLGKGLYSLMVGIFSYGLCADGSTCNYSSTRDFALIGAWTLTIWGIAQILINCSVSFYYFLSLILSLI